MIIFKVTNSKSNKSYIGYSINDNPNFLGSGRYIKRAIKIHGQDSFNKEILESLDSVDEIQVINRVDYWIKEYETDNPKYGYNERLEDLIPKKKMLTEKLQVLLAKEDVDSLNDIIIEESMKENRKPIPISRYIRNLIKKHITEIKNNK